MPFQKTCVDVNTINEVLVCHDLLMERYCRLDPLYDVLIESPGHSLDRFFTGVCMHNQFGDHRIIVRQDGILVINSTVDTNSEAAGSVITVDLTREWREFLGIFGVDATFYCMTVDLDILLYAQLRIESEVLTVPHPGICKRDFVYLPLLKLNPDVEVPGKGRLRDIVETANDRDTDYACQFAGNIVR